MKKNFRIVLALVLALSMVLGMVPAMADPPTTDDKGSITINSPIMGAQYFAYRIFTMTLNDDTAPDAFGYFIGHDDPFYKAVAAYAETADNGLQLTGVKATYHEAVADDSTTPENEATPAYYDEYVVTVDDRFDAQDFGKTLQGKLAKTGYDGDDKIVIPTGEEYTPTYEKTSDDPITYATVVTPGVADAITFNDLPYGYYLITNNYDNYTGKHPTVKLMNGNTKYAEFGPSTYEDGIKWEKDDNGALVLDDTGNPIVVDVEVDGLAEAAAALALEVYPGLAAAEAQYKADHAGDPTVKTWEQIVADNGAGGALTANDILDQYRASYKQSAIDQVKRKIMAALSDENAYDGVTDHKARLVFIDSTTPNGVINEKNEYEKWDVPVNPEGVADAEGTPNHDEPKGGKNIVVQEATYNADGSVKTGAIYANSAEYAIGDKVHYQLSINAVNFERADKDDPKSVKQIQEYIIADYQNKNMAYVEKEPVTNGDAYWIIGEDPNQVKYNYGLTVRIVKKDAAGNITWTSDPMDYSAWVEHTTKGGRFFVNPSHEDLPDDAANIFTVDANAKGGIVIPWVEQLTKGQNETPEQFQARLAQAKNLFKNSVFAYNDEGVTTLSDGADPDAYTIGEDGKYHAKIPVYAQAINPYTDDGVPMLGQQYMLEYGDGTKYDWISETTKDENDKTVTTYWLVDENDQKVQAIDKTGAKVWEATDYYFASKYDNDVTILVDYWMELKDTAVIDGEGNENISQFGVNYTEPYTTTYEFGTTTNPGNNPPDGPQIPKELKEQDDAVVYTYAIAIKKVDVAGNQLVGAKFKLRGVTVTEKTQGYYKVKDYEYNAEDTPATWANSDEMKTDDKGLLIVEGLPTKWKVEIMETEAPLGYNKLTDTVELKPFKTGDEVTTRSTTTYKVDENGNVFDSTVITTTDTIYKVNGAEVAKMTEIGGTTTLYTKSNTEWVLATETAFNNAIGTAFNGDAKKVEITKDAQANIAEFAIVNNKGAELPSTGGIGTTIFYVGGSLMVLAAAILLITKRRMGAED